MSEKALDSLQRDTFGYFLNETNPANGLVPDNTREGAPCSITAVGMALAAYVVGAERGFITRASATERTLTTLRFFWNSPHGEEPDATGYKGFYYHFLDMQTGRRVWKSELSTIDTTFLLAGALVFQGPMAGHVAGQPWHYELHVWLWDTNPNGMFAQWNPSISCN